MSILNILYIVIICLCLCDSGLTIYIVSKGGKEANPVDSWLGSKIGVSATQFITKLALFIAIWFFVKNLWGLVAIAAAFGGIVLWNVYQAKKTP